MKNAHYCYDLYDYCCYDYGYDDDEKELDANEDAGDYYYWHDDWDYYY